MIVKSLRDRNLRFVVATGSPVSKTHVVFDSPAFRALCLEAVKKKAATAIEYNGVTLTFSHGENAMVKVPFMYRIDSATYCQPVWLALAEAVYRDVLYTHMAEGKTSAQLTALRQSVTANIAQIKEIDPMIKWYTTTVVVLGSTSYRVMIPTSKQEVAGFIGTTYASMSTFSSTRSFVVDKIAADWIASNPGVPISETKVEQMIAGSKLMNWVDGHLAFESSYTRSVLVDMPWDLTDPELVWTAFTMFTSGNTAARTSAWTELQKKVLETYPTLAVGDLPTTMTPYMALMLVDLDLIKVVVDGEGDPKMPLYHDFQVKGVKSIVGRTFDSVSVGDGVTTVIYKKHDCPSELWKSFSDNPLSYSMTLPEFVAHRETIMKKCVLLLDLSFRVLDAEAVLPVGQPFYSGRIGWVLDAFLGDLFTSKGEVKYGN